MAFASLLQARTLLGAPGRTTRNKKLLGAPGIATRSKDATRGAWSRCLPARRPVGGERTASGRDREKRRFLLPSESNVWHRESTSEDEIKRFFTASESNVWHQESTPEDEIEKIFTAVRKQRLAPREHL